MTRTERESGPGVDLNPYAIEWASLDAGEGVESARLYILMRCDRPDMNAGKASAQASHASNQCVAEARGLTTGARGGSREARLSDQISAWEGETGKGFGTCIVLSSSERQMREAVRSAQSAGLHAGIVHDPTYPVGIPDRPYAVWNRDSVILALFAVASFAAGAQAWLPILVLLYLVGCHARELAMAVRRDMAVAAAPVIPLDTCAFIFGTRTEVSPHIKDLSLMH